MSYPKVSCRLSLMSLSASLHVVRAGIANNSCLFTNLEIIKLHSRLINKLCFLSLYLRHMLNVVNCWQHRSRWLKRLKRRASRAQTTHLLASCEEMMLFNTLHRGSLLWTTATLRNPSSQPHAACHVFWQLHFLPLFPYFRITFPPAGGQNKGPELDLLFKLCKSTLSTCPSTYCSNTLEVHHWPTY